MKNIIKKLRFIVLSGSLLTMVKIQSSGIVPTIAAKAISTAGLGQISSTASTLAANAQTALSAMTGAKASTSTAVTLAGSQIHHPFVGSMPVIMSAKAAVAATIASLTGIALPVGICAAYAGTIAHVTYRVKQEQKRLAHTPENIYELGALHEDIPLLDQGNDNGGNSDNGNRKTHNKGSWYKSTKFKIAAPGLGASIVAGMMKYFNQPEEQQQNSVEQLLDYLHEPTETKFGKSADQYATGKDSAMSYAQEKWIARKGKSSIVKAYYDRDDKQNMNTEPSNFGFFVWHNTVDKEIYDKLQARQKSKKVDLELPLKAFCDVSSQAYQDHNRVLDYKGRDKQHFSIDAGKYGKYICRPGHLGVSNLNCDSEKEWEDIIKRELKWASRKKEINEESAKAEAAKK